jgi:hypothetical protein
LEYVDQEHAIANIYVTPVREVEKINLKFEVTKDGVYFDGNCVNGERCVKLPV